MTLPNFCIIIGSQLCIRYQSIECHRCLPLKSTVIDMKDSHFTLAIAFIDEVIGYCDLSVRCRILTHIGQNALMLAVRKKASFLLLVTSTGIDSELA